MVTFYYRMFQTVTFQMSILTDGVNTYSKQVYDDRAMGWDFFTLDGTPYPAVNGYFHGNQDHQNPVSYLPLTEANADKLPFIQTIDQYSASATVLQNAGIDAQGIKGTSNGVYYFKMTNNDGTTTNNALICSAWLVADIADDASLAVLDDTSISNCACTRSQMTDSLYTMSSSTSTLTCYKKILPVNNSHRCCYDAENNLVTDAIQTAGKNTFIRKTDFAADDVAFASCCAPDIASFSNLDLCNSFLIRRPASDCSLFVAGGAGNHVWFLIHVLWLTLINI